MIFFSRNTKIWSRTFDGGPYRDYGPGLIAQDKIQYGQKAMSIMYSFTGYATYSEQCFHQKLYKAFRVRNQ